MLWESFVCLAVDWFLNIVRYITPKCCYIKNFFKYILIFDNKKYISLTSLANTYLNITRKNINDLNLNKNHKMDPSNPVWITQQKHFIVLYVHVHTNKFIWTVLHPVLIYAPWLYPICIEHHNICDCLGHPSPNIQKWSSSYLAKNVIFFPIWKGGGGGGSMNL